MTAVFCAPGNAGTALDVQNVAIEPGDQRGLVQFARREGIGLTVVGPEEPLAKGIVDVFQREGLRIFGPRKDAAELEGSKVFAKDLMRQAGIPTADYRVFRSAPDAEHYILSREVSLVVRSRGRSTMRHTLHCRTAGRDPGGDRTDPRPARDAQPRCPGRDRGAGPSPRVSTRSPTPAISCWAGRSAWSSRPMAWLPAREFTSATTFGKPLEAIDQIMIRRIFGQAGDRLLIEERLDGHETSVLALTDGRTIVPLESSQDYKRAFDHDEGPNTGGMGAFSPTPRVTPALMEEVEREILVPIVHALKRARRPVPGRHLRRLDADQPGTQGSRVQRPLRRSGDPGRPDAAEVRPAGRARGRGRRAAGFRCPGVGSPAPR